MLAGSSLPISLPVETTVDPANESESSACLRLSPSSLILLSVSLYSSNLYKTYIGFGLSGSLLGKLLSSVACLPLGVYCGGAERTESSTMVESSTPLTCGASLPSAGR